MRAFASFAIESSFAIEFGRPRFITGRQLRGLFCVMMIGLAARPTVAASPSLLELTQNGKQYEGRLEAKGHDACWLMGRDGQLRAFEIHRLQAVRTVDDH